jgi:hypothetical protein
MQCDIAKKRRKVMELLLEKREKIGFLQKKSGL